MGYLDVTSLQVVKNVIKEFSSLKKEFNSLTTFEKFRSNKPQSTTPTNTILYTGEILTYGYKIEKKLLDYKELIVFENNEEQFTNRHKDRRLQCPIHDQILLNNPSIRQLFYNIMLPGAKINPHYGVNGKATNKIPDHFRIHITMDPGDNAYFFIANMDPLKYYEGLCFGFEDGLVSHWAENHGTQNRTVLILDVDKSIIPTVLPSLEIPKC